MGEPSGERDEHLVEGYENRAIGVLYDWLNRLLWLPYGSDRLRRELVRTLAPTTGDDVLELGCGTGLVTRHLLATGADVTAVDGAPTMLARARRRAPQAAFDQRHLGDDLPAGPFDAVVLSFVLHELDPAARVDLLRRSARRLAPDRGQIAVLEWGTPRARRRGAIWKRVVRAIEPAVAHDVLDGALDQAIAAAALTVTAESAPAGGRARVLLLR